MKKVYTDEQLNYIRELNLQIGDSIYVLHKSRIKHMQLVLCFSWVPAMNKFIGSYATIFEIRSNGLGLQFKSTRSSDRYFFPFDCFISDNYKLSTDDYEIF